MMEKVTILSYDGEEYHFFGEPIYSDYNKRIYEVIRILFGFPLQNKGNFPFLHTEIHEISFPEVEYL